MTWTLELLVDGVDAFDDAGSVTVARGVKVDGVLDKLEPGELKATLQGAGYFPDTNTHVRAGRTTVLRLTDGVTTHEVFTGRNDDLALHPAKTATALPAVELSCLDLVATLAQVKTFDSTGGNLTQRVDAALVDAAGITYTVHDPDPAGATPVLATDAKSALEQFRRVIDTAHAIAYADGSNELQAYADTLRPSGPAVLTLTDGTAAGDVDYVDLDRDASSRDVVNDLTLTRLDTDETATYVDEISADTYGPRTQAVTVLEGSLEDHAWRFLSLRWPAVDTIRSVTINATLSDIWPTVAQLNPYDIVDVVTDGGTIRSRVLFLDHTITPRKGLPPKWILTLALARLDRSPVTWDQVPAAVTWDTVPATVTWNNAATWNPEA